MALDRLTQITSSGISSDSTITVSAIAGVITATSATVTGNLVGNTASFSGNVSIAGTLTYEDVTNIDSIGIITARSGINATGIVTATGFVGDVTGDVNSTGVSTFSNVVVGGGTTQLIVNGDTRITGILTVGESSVTINGNTNTISGINSVTDNSGGYLTIPPGAVQFFARDTAPNGWVKANGASLSSTTYADLFAAIGYTFGGSGGSFTLPDLRGEFPRGWDDSRGIDSGRVFGTAQADQMQQITGYLVTTYAVVRSTATGALTGSSISGGSVTTSPSFPTSASAGNLTFDSANSSGARTGTETRSRNIALLACIKY